MARCPGPTDGLVVLPGGHEAIDLMEAVMEWDWKPFRPPVKAESNLPPYTGPGFATCKLDPLRNIEERKPSVMLGDHPALTPKTVMAPPSRAEIAHLFYQLTGRMPPSSVAEWKAQLEAEGRELPKHVQDYLKEHPEIE